MTLAQFLTAAGFTCWGGVVAISLIVVIADHIPAPRRPAPDYDGQVTWTDPPTGSIPVTLPDIVIDEVARASRIDRAGQALVRLREGLLRQRASVLGLVDAIDRRLLAISDAETGPTPVVRDEQPAGGER